MTTLSISWRSARRYFILIIGFALVASAGVMRSHLDSVDPPSSREKLSSMQLSRGVVRVGDVMPANALKLRRLGGDDIDLQQASPGRTVIAFWASWCGPCIRDLQLLRDQKALLDSHGVGVVAIAIDREGNIRSIVDSEQLGFAVLLADMNGVQPLSVFGLDRIVLPYTVLLDSQHRVLFADSGSIDKERLTRLLLTNFAATK